MAKNISNYIDRTLYDFRSRLVGGGSRPNLFECEITFPELGGIEALTDSDKLDLRFLIKAAQLPGSTIGSIPVPFRGRTLKIAGDRTYDPWTITVINDTKFNLRNLFEQWSNAMNRHDDNTGVITPSLYQREIIVRQLSRGIQDTSTVVGGDKKISVLKSYKLWGCFPTSVDPIPLSYDSNDTIEEFNVTFEVQWMDALDPNDSSIFSSAVDTVVGTLPT